MNKIVDLQAIRAQQRPSRARVSVSLRNLSRRYRREIIRSWSFECLQGARLSREEYTLLLQCHHAIRQSLAVACASNNGTFKGVDLFTQEEKFLDVARFVTPARNRVSALHSDLNDMVEPVAEQAPQQAEALVAYIERANEVYPAALLGVLYMLEETLTYAGPAIANSLDDGLALEGKAQQYIRACLGNKADLWRFRKSLDGVEDFQTQANIVIASTITYGLYRDMLNSVLQVSQTASKLVH